MRAYDVDAHVEESPETFSDAYFDPEFRERRPRVIELPGQGPVDGDTGRPWYVRQPFGREPDFGVTSVNYDLGELLARAEAPEARPSGEPRTQTKA